MYGIPAYGPGYGGNYGPGMMERYGGGYPLEYGPMGPAYGEYYMDGP